MSENKDSDIQTSRYAGIFDKNGAWYAAGAFLLAIVAALVVLVVLPAKDDESTDAGTSTVPTGPAPLSSPAATSSSSAQPAVTGWADLGCNGTKGTTSVPNRAPEASWVPVGSMSAPVSTTFGPLETNGFIRGCYQHTPSGAVFAAINLITAFATAPASERQAVIEAGVTPGSFRDESIEAPQGELGWKIAAFHVESCTPDRCNLVLIISAKGALGQANAPMVWVDGDWRLDGTQNAGGGGVAAIPPGYVSWGA